MPTVALASEFLDAFARLPRAQQRKVREFTEKFKANPKSAAINYEKIHDVRDDKVRTVRIDQKYRAVVLHPDQGDVYVLVWVDNHDEAMAWARNRRSSRSTPSPGRCRSSASGGRTGDPGPTGRRKRPAPGLFAATTTTCCCPSASLPSCCPRCGPSGRPPELLALSKHLPAEAAEALTWLAEGIPPEEIRAAVVHAEEEGGHRRPGGCPGTPRHAAAVRHDPVGQRLDGHAGAPLEKWRVFLHPSQEKLVAKKFNGPARVMGGAGTGKTVVAMHRARHLASKVFTGEDRPHPVHDLHGQPGREHRGMLSDLCGPSGSASRSSTCTPGPCASCGRTGSRVRSPAPTTSRRAGRRRSWPPGLRDFDPASSARSGSRWSRPTASRRWTSTCRCPDGPGPDGVPTPAGQGLEGLRAVPAGPGRPGHSRNGWR